MPVFIRAITQSYTKETQSFTKNQTDIPLISHIPLYPIGNQLFANCPPTIPLLDFCRILRAVFKQYNSISTTIVFLQ